MPSRVPQRIGTLAADLGINPKTIRYYEEIGLLPVPQRTMAGYRQYGAADVERLRFIIKAKAIGFTLREIREILTMRDDGSEPCPYLGNLLAHKLATVDAQLRLLGELRGALGAAGRDGRDGVLEHADLWADRAA